MTTTREIAKFKSMSIKSKRELLRALDCYLTRLKSKSFQERKVRQVRMLAKLMQEFRTSVAASDLAFLESGYERYEVTIFDIDIVLEAVNYVEIEFDDQGLIESSVCEVSPNLICVRAPFVSVSEFAASRGVELSTVLRWIDEGRLKNLEWEDSAWHIAESQDVFENEIVNGTFICERNNGDLSTISDLSFGAMYWEISGSPAFSDESELDVREYDRDMYLISEKRISRSLYKKIEKDMLMSNEVVFSSNSIEVIDEKAPLVIGDISVPPPTMHQVEKAIDGLKMEPESRMILDSIVKEIQSEELLLDAIEELGIESELAMSLKVKVSS